VAAQRQGQLFERNAAAIVFHQDLADAAGHQLDGDLAGARVQGVIDQFAHDRGRTLDHLAGGNLADQLVGQLADVAARARLTGPRGLHIFGQGGAGGLLRHPRIVGGGACFPRGMS
jgi:hypothetical protein